jgi:hypothetical protein
MDRAVLDTLDKSLERCTSRSQFVDLFYTKFLASSPKVREKFNDTDFVRQKRALKASLHMILLAAEEPETCGSTASWRRWRSATPSSAPRSARPGRRS